jgi:16S rRNA (adenine1518-N6/adenine1519-N6)-dimethyltransferase
MAFTLKDVQDQLRSLGIAPKKSLGQNFLINSQSIDRILDRVQRLKFSSMLEVGPGLGALTNPLSQLGKPLILIELDREFSNLWREKGFRVVEGDALRVDWMSLGLEAPALLISNLPYQISSSLVIDRSVEPFGVEHMILMFQKEVAQRLLAKEKTPQYGLLTVIAQSAWRVEKLFEISSKDFFPPPAVASQVVLFERLNRPVSRKFLNMVKMAFAHRRKLLIKNISGLADSKVLDDVWGELKLNRQARAEDLSPAQFQRLFDAINDKKPSGGMHANET